MFVISRVLKVQKNLQASNIERLSKPTPLIKSKGFIRRDILIGQKNPEFDVIRIMVYWQDKNNNHNKPLEGLIDATVEQYELVLTNTNEAT
ncbi:MAG: hypothetical protein IH571_05310 [Acholeplasmataceae bacterium]|nr:hypothetical protein [Acholeplasmataceae bacterium]